MGTNFYTLEGKHIGKRSAAGLWCWDCGLTLCKAGVEGVHHGKHQWSNECLRCGKTQNMESPSAAYKELGFLKEKDKPIPKGVSSVSSFRWAIEPSALKGRRKIKNEYGDIFTREEFESMLKDWCPIQYSDMIGREFF